MKMLRLLALFLQNKQLAEKAGFPLFKERLYKVTTAPLSKIIDDILEWARLRYVAKQKKSVCETQVIATLTFDDLFLLKEGDRHTREFTGNADIKVFSKMNTFIDFSSALFGYKLHNECTQIGLFTGIINTVAQYSLPYTFYLLGGKGSAPFKIREYFCAIFPDLKYHFVGMSSVVKDSEEHYQSLKRDIEEKSPDFLFVSLGNSVADSFVQRLITEQVDLGVMVTLGDTFNYFVSTRKKEVGFVRRLNNTVTSVISMLR